MKKCSIALALTAALAPAICPGATPSRPSNLHWIVSQSSVARLRHVLSPNDILELFDNSNTYVLVNAPNKDDQLPHAKHVLFYRDETLIAPDIASGKLARYDGALYDDEAYDEPGNSTPQEQKENPLPYAQDAAKVLHSAGKIFVYTIGSATGPAGAFWTQTLPSVSRYPDVIDFQTQGAEGTARFAALVAHYSTVYRNNGGRVMLVGLGVSPKGQSKSADDIRAAYDAALANQPPVDGFWLNMAVKSRSCTGCSSSPDISPGVQFLRSLIH